MKRNLKKIMSPTRDFFWVNVPNGTFSGPFESEAEARQDAEECHEEGNDEVHIVVEVRLGASEEEKKVKWNWE